MPLTLQRLQTHQNPAFNTLVTLYEQAFPASERKSIATLHQMITKESCHFLLATEDDTTIGFSIAHVLSDNTAAIVEYMAIAPTHRNQGLGRQLFLTIAQHLQAPPRTLLLELESDHTPSPEQAQRTRRKRFYQNLGAQEIQGLHWLMPQVSPTPPPPMDMMIYPTTPIPKTQLKQWLTSIYTEVYQQDPNDPRIATMLQPFL